MSKYATHYFLFPQVTDTLLSMVWCSFSLFDDWIITFVINPLSTVHYISYVIIHDHHTLLTTFAPPPFSFACLPSLFLLVPFCFYITHIHEHIVYLKIYI